MNRNELVSIIKHDLLKTAGIYATQEYDEDQSIYDDQGNVATRYTVPHMERVHMDNYGGRFGHHGLHMQGDDVVGREGLKNDRDVKADHRALASLGLGLAGAGAGFVGVAAEHVPTFAAGAGLGVGAIIAGILANNQRKKADAKREFGPEVPINDMLHRDGYHDFSERHSGVSDADLNRLKTRLGLASQHAEIRNAAQNQVVKQNIARSSMSNGTATANAQY